MRECGFDSRSAHEQKRIFMSEQTERLKSTVTDLSGTQKEIHAELRAEDVGLEYERILEEYAGRVKLKGFRQGKAPKGMVKQMFAPEIRKAVLDSLIPRVLEEVQESHAVRPAGVPVINDISYDEGQPLRFKAVVEVWPEFDLPPYKQIKVRKKDIDTSDEDVQRALEELRDKSAEYMPADGRGAAEGDYVVIELQGKDRKTKKLMPTEKAVVLVGHKDNDPAINENLPGLKSQEERTFIHAYPADTKNKKLAGREIEYRIKVISIKERRVPELNDDFAKTLGEYDNLAAVKEKIRQEIQKAREETGRRETAEEILQAVVEKASIELPASPVDDEAEAVLKNILSSAPRHNLSQEAWAELRSRAREQAEKNLKRHLVLRKIAEIEAIKVEEEDVDKEIRTLAKENNIPLDRAQEAVNRESLKRSLLLRRTVDFLVEKAIIE